MQGLLNNVKEYTDKNFAHVFTVIAMTAVLFIVYPVLYGTAVWSVFLTFYSGAAAAIGRHHMNSERFKALNHDKSLWA